MIISYNNNNYNKCQFEHLQDTLFERVRSVSVPIQETTTHGLDEITHEIREDLKSNMDQDTKTKLQLAEIISVKNSELIEENKSLTNANDLLTWNLSKFNKDNELLNKQLAEQIDDNANLLRESKNAIKTISYLKELTKNGYTFWNKKRILESIISILK